MKNKILSLNRFFLAVLALATFTGSGVAATRITYDEIAKRLAGPDGVLDHRGITIVTNDGKTHSGRRMAVKPDHLRIYHEDRTFEDLPRDTVERIEISQAGRFSHHVAENSQLWIPEGASDDAGTEAAAIALIPPVLAYTAASAPVLLAADAITFLIPPRVYEIIP
jgi:hypothetical protein